MNWVDWLVIALVLLGVIQGILRGWSAATLGILVVALAFVGASALLPIFADSVGSLPMPADWARTIAFGIVLVGLYVILSLVANALRGSGRRASLQSQIPGAVIGVARGAALAMAVLGLLVASPESEAMKKDTEASRLGAPLLRGQRATMTYVHDRLPFVPPIGPDRRL